MLTLDSGYVARFIFETAKISQLFCHQIIWNMKANCYKDDAAEVVSVLYPSVFCSSDTSVIGGPSEAHVGCNNGHGGEVIIR